MSTHALSRPQPSLLPAYGTRLVRLALAVSLVLLSACQTVPATNGALTAGTQASIEGTVQSVDTAPWAFDGNATVTIDTTTHGRVDVQLPARWNLCKASAPPDPN